MPPPHTRERFVLIAMNGWNGDRGRGRGRIRWNQNWENNRGHALNSPPAQHGRTNSWVTSDGRTHICIARPLGAACSCLSGPRPSWLSPASKSQLSRDAIKKAFLRTREWEFFAPHRYANSCIVGVFTYLWLPGCKTCRFREHKISSVLLKISGFSMVIRTSTLHTLIDVAKFPSRVRSRLLPNDCVGCACGTLTHRLFGMNIS